MVFRRKTGRKGFERLDAGARAITFYAEDGGSWPHFAPIVEELLAAGRSIAYLTSSDRDPILTREDPRVEAFEIGEGFGRSYLFQTMEAGAVVATVPRLGISVLPRSKRAAQLGMEYLYVFHSMVSTHMIYDADGFDQYDTVLCVGPHMVEEIRRREELHGLARKDLVEHGYGRLDAIMAAAADAPPPANDPPRVLVAPSWGPDCIFERCGAEVVGPLLEAGFEVVARPHPMTRKRTPDAVPALRDRFGSHPHFVMDEDVAAQDALLAADIMVSDWSGAALEYAYGVERPVLFVDVPRKVNNPDYEELGIEPFEVSVRESIGEVLPTAALADIGRRVDAMLGAAGEFRDRIVASRAASVFNVGSSGAVGARIVAERADRAMAGR